MDYTAVFLTKCHASYQYDGNDRLEQVTFPNGKTLNFDYNDRDNISLVTSSDKMQSALTYINGLS